MEVKRSIEKYREIEKLPTIVLYMAAKYAGNSTSAERKLPMYRFVGSDAEFSVRP